MTNLRRIWWLGLVLSLWSCDNGRPALKGDLLISGGLIVNLESGSTSEPKDILIANKAIIAIVDHDQKKRADYIEVVDATGLYLLPGLIDVHAHVGDGGLLENDDVDRRGALAQFLRYGVTSIFVPGGGGGNDVQLNAWKAYCAKKEGHCPRVFGSGNIITAQGSHPISTIWGFPDDVDPKLVFDRGATGIGESDSVDELIAAKLAAKVDALKIVVEDGPGAFAPKPRLSRDKVAEICAKAHAVGLRVFAHVSLAEHVVDVVDGHCDAIMHAPDDVLSDRTLQAMADRKIFYVATLSLFDALMDQEAGHREQELYAIAGVSEKALASLESDDYWTVSRESPELIAEWKNALSWNLRRANEFGVPIALGTDTNNPQVFPGYSVHEELALMVAAGLDEADALKAATATAAAFLEQSETIGTVSVGALADILALRANPLDDILNTRKIAFVLANGIKVDGVVAVP